MIKIGDKVKIINPGEYYPSFTEIARLMGATKYIPDEFDENYYEELKNKEGIVKNIIKDHGNILCLLDLGNSEIIINMVGLKNIELIEVYGIVTFMNSLNKRK